MNPKYCIKMLYLTTLLFPFFGFVALFIPYFSYLKDVLCVLMCIFSLLNRNASIDKSYIGVILYTLMVMGSIVVDFSTSTSFAIDLFRYRAEYAIVMTIVFSTLELNLEELQHIGDKLMKIIFYTGIIVALIGVVEFINPSLIHSLYGSRLTQHLSLLLAGDVSGRLVSTLSNPITLGLEMSISIVSGLYLINQCKSTNIKIFLIYPSLILFGFIALYTYSRTSYIAIVGAISIYLFCTITKSKISFQQKVLIILTTITIIVATYYVIQSIPSLSSRLNSVNSDSFHNNVRYERAISAFNEPHGIITSIFGFGVGKIAGSSGQFVFEFGFASLLYESGIIGLVIFLLYSFKSIFIYWKTSNNDKCYGVGVSCICIITGFWLTMFTVDAYSQAPYNYYFWLSVAFMLKCNTLYKNSVNETEIFK